MAFGGRTTFLYLTGRIGLDEYYDKKNRPKVESLRASGGELAGEERRKKVEEFVARAVSLVARRKGK